MRSTFIRIAMLLGISLCAASLHAESSSTARGGLFFAYHFNPLSAFDSELNGNPFTVGGEGFAQVFQNFRVGGAGGGGFVWASRDNITFGLGYGGVLGEYAVTKWFAIRMLIGGGGYAVAKVTQDSISSSSLSKLSAGGFILFYPSIKFEIPLGAMVKLTTNIGYFLPNKSQLHSVTFGLSLLFGKTS